MKLLISEEKIEEELHVSWWIIVYKMLLGVSELLLGLGISFFGRMALHWYRVYAAEELSEDPHDLLVQLTKNVVPNLLTHHTFLVFYLVVLGCAKIAGAVGLIYKQNWGVDLLVGLTLLMFPFQLIQFLITPSLLDFFYILIGLFIAMYLINFKPHEWAAHFVKKVKHHAKQRMEKSAEGGT